VGELSLRFAQFVLGFLPIMHIDTGAVPLENPPIFIPQWKCGCQTPAIRSICSVDKTRFHLVGHAGRDTRGPSTRSLVDVVWIKELPPAIVHHFTGSEASII
jgi:hypothetical protein